MRLNQRAWRRCEELLSRADELNVVARRQGEDGALLIDCGLEAPGGLEAGRLLAEICLADLGRVEITPGAADVWAGPAVTVRTDQPLAACLASQYAGWRISGDGYFAMGSGPMRAAAAREALFAEIGFQETSRPVVGVLEASRPPPPEVCARVAADCGVAPRDVALLIARTASVAGAVQVVARSVETALHKLHHLKFDVRRVRGGFGAAPLPPVAAKDRLAIGRTNDAVLYGAQVTLWVTGDDASLREIGPRAPSSSSPDFGRPFVEIFEDHGRDFYKVDPNLFSPAVIEFVNVETGGRFRYGQTNPDVLRKSFGG